MSYRDVRNFTEMLRILGYPKLVSMESFRSPNFVLVANLLVWLSKRFDPDHEIPLEIETEEGRIALIRNVAQFMATKANVKLNTKKLYQADGYAVKELLKITAVLKEALEVSPINENENDDEEVEEEEGDGVSLRDFDISDKISDLKHCRHLATEIAETGATLYELLGKESELRIKRQKSVGRQLEVAEVEDGVKKAIEAVKRDIEETKLMIDNVSATEASLDAKIERRRSEIERYEKRLQTLKKVKPAFLEEFTSLESELEKLFTQYSLRVRCLNHLEHLAAEAERAHLERQKFAASQKITETVPLDRGEPAELFGLEDSMSQQEIMVMENEEKSPAAAKQERPRARTGRLRPDHQSRLHDLMGSLSGSSLDLSSSGSEDLFLDKDEPELLAHSDDDSLGLELSMSQGKNLGFSGRKTSNNVLNYNANSDDDF